VAAGKSEAEVTKLIRAAIEMHVEGLREDGLPIPHPTSRCLYVETAVA
jgi:predicted RNase H-like HicB family nuclease